MFKVTEEKELSSKELEIKIKNLKEKEIPEREERIKKYKSEQDNSKDEKRNRTLDNKIKVAEKEISEFEKRIKDLEMKLEDKLSSEKKTNRKNVEDRFQKYISKRNKTEKDDKDVDISNEEKKSYEDFAEYLKDNVSTIRIESSDKSVKVLRKCLPDLDDDQFILRSGTTSGGYPMKFGISAVLKVKNLDKCPKEYLDYFNSNGEITEVSKVFPILNAYYDELKSKIVTQDVKESLNKKMKPTVYNILGWLINHNKEYKEFKDSIKNNFENVTKETLRNWIKSKKDLCVEYENYFEDKLCEDKKTITLPHEEYTKYEDLVRINDELNKKASEGKLVGIRQEKNFLQLSEPAINGIWNIWLDEKGFISKIVLF